MEENDPACRGDWDVALRAAGIDARDEAYSFLYLGT
jgi:phosphonoacetate hydrolase